MRRWRCGRFFTLAALVFKERLERLSEVLLILLVGGMLFVDSWSWAAVGFAAFVFLLARPAGVLLAMLGSGARWRAAWSAGSACAASARCST